MFSRCSITAGSSPDQGASPLVIHSNRCALRTRGGRLGKPLVKIFLRDIWAV
jgi:hypothetical protein